MENTLKNKELEFLDRNTIKYLLIVLMTLDHLTVIPPFNTNETIYNIIVILSRIVGPIMAYFLAEGYYYTRNVSKYVLRLGIFSVVSWIAYTFYKSGQFIPIRLISGNVNDGRAFLYVSSIDKTFVVYESGVIFTLFLGLLMICLWDRAKIHPIFKILISAIILYFSAYGDWKYWNVLFCLTFYMLRDRKVLKWIVYSLICVPYIFLFRIFSNPLAMPEITTKYSALLFGVFLVIPVIELFYNGKIRGKNKFNKWFFYIYYPLHLIIIGIIKIFVE